MNITVIYATGRKAQSASYNIAQLLIRELLGEDELFSFHLPQDMPHICVGCYTCIRGREEACGGAAALAPILAAMQRSELILFCTPTYAFHVPGQMKSLLDHLAYRWMVHRPELSLLKKQAVIINTAAGGGMRSTAQEIKDSTDYWGVARTHILSQKVWDYDWTNLPASFRAAAEKKVARTAKIVRRHAAHLTPSLKVRCLFTLYRFLHGKQRMSAVDDAYWEKMGYLAGNPWEVPDKKLLTEKENLS